MIELIWIDAWMLSYLKKWKWTITNSHSLEVICPSLVWPPTHLWVQYMFLVCKPWGWFTGVRWQYSHLSSSSCVYLFTSNFIWVWLWIYYKWTRYEPTGCPYEILQAIGWRMEKKIRGKKKIGLSVYRKTLSFFIFILWDATIHIKDEMRNLAGMRWGGPWSVLFTSF